MSQRSLWALGTLAAAIAGVLLATGCAGGQPQTAAADAWTPSRTAWDDPDLQGIWSAGYILTPLERPDEFAGREFLTDEEVAALEKAAVESPGRNRRADAGSVADVEGAYNDAFTGRGTRVVRTKRTSLIVDPPDGKIPFTPEARKRAAAETANRRALRERADGPEDRPNDRCVGVTLPINFGSAGVSGAYSRIVQTPGSVALYYESGHQGGIYRSIPLDGRPHLPPHARQWIGDPHGRWEGHTLVVDTTHFTNQTNYQGSGENLHLVERFTRVAPDMIMYHATIDDPTMFAQSWTIEVPLTKSDDKENPIFEAACHEGNYALTSILAGARALEREVARTPTESK